MAEPLTGNSRVLRLVGLLGAVMLMRMAPGWSARVGDERERERGLSAAFAQLNAAWDLTDDDQLRTLRDSMTRALPEATALGTASSSFVSEVAEAAVAAGLQLETLTPEGDSAILAPFLLARVRGEGWGDVGTLMTFLSLLENQPARLRVRELSVTPTNPDDAGAERLRLRVMVEGVYRRKQGTGS